MKSANLGPARKRLELELGIALNCLREMGDRRDVHGMTGVAGDAVPDLLEKAHHVALAARRRSTTWV